MKIEFERKMQIEFLKGEFTWCAEFEKSTFFTEGKYGVFINNKKLLIKIDDIRKIDKPENFDPKMLIETTNEAKLTRNIIMLPDRRMAIKLITDDGKYAYVDMKLIKPFGEYVKFRISDEKSVIVITDIKKEVVGIAMPMRIQDEN